MIEVGLKQRARRATPFAQHAPPCSSTSRLATTEAGAKAARDRWESKSYKEMIASDASGWLFIVASIRNVVPRSRMGGKLVFRIYAICLRCNRCPESTSNVGMQSKGPPPVLPRHQVPQNVCCTRSSEVGGKA